MGYKWVKQVDLEPRSLRAYKGIITDELYDEIATLGRQLRGYSVVQLNATPAGGGVAEMLRSMVPLFLGLGLDVEWYVLNHADDGFFELTKKLHNLLQGRRGSVGRAEQELYLEHAERYARSLRHLRPDFWEVHDPQPLPIVDHFDTSKATWVWRSHIDTSRPNRAALGLLAPYIRRYDRAIFSLPDYAPANLPPEQLLVFQPAIDPLTTKNRPLPLDVAKKKLRGLGIDPARPLVVQVSRFDPWKDPRGVIDAYRLARAKVPGLQLALVGVFSALDDPEAPRIYGEIERYRDGDPDIHLYRDPEQVGDVEVNAFQVGADVVLQKSLREGFGLTVTEAMWKGTPVIGGDVGGIRTQIDDGENGFLVSSVEEAAERMVQLLADDDLRRALGAAGRESARRRLLLPRLVRDYLKLFHASAREADLPRAA